jgi:hypothetical protein
MTFAPSALKCWAVAKPIPVVPPGWLAARTYVVGLFMLPGDGMMLPDVPEFLVTWCRPWIDAADSGNI